MAGLGRQTRNAATHFTIGATASVLFFGGLAACGLSGSDSEPVRVGSADSVLERYPSDPASPVPEAEARRWETAEAPAEAAPPMAQERLLRAGPADQAADDGLEGAARQRRASPARLASPTGSVANGWGSGAGGAGHGAGSTGTASRPGGGGRYGTQAAAPAAPIARALPQNGVLASNFVGGSGAQARLEDLLDRGVMVAGENVRLEAFDELGRLPYPVPSDEAVGLHAELERSRLLADGERVHLQIALMARRGEAPPRPRMDVRLVFDRSGSMMGDKWTHAIDAAHALVDRLQPGDTFGLVSDSDDAPLSGGTFYDGIVMYRNGVLTPQ